MSDESESWIKNLKEANLFEDIDESWKKFGNLLERAINDAGERTIETKFGDSAFKTHVALDNDISNELPANSPKADDEYWIWHKALVENVLDTRKQIMLKVIETVGVTIKGIVNPISFSNIDIGKIIESITKKA